MTKELVKKLLDACFLAKRITEIIPELPKGLKPRHIHVIAYIAEHGSGGESVRVSDVSGGLKVTMPSITKLINELETLQLVEKSILVGDKRAATLSLTTLGTYYYDIYVTHYHNKLAQALPNLDANDVLTAIATMERLNNAVSKIARKGFYGNEN